MIKRHSDLSRFMRRLESISQAVTWESGYPVAEFWEAYDEAMLELREIEPALELMRRCDGMWHDLEFVDWLPNLVEEVGELAGAITGKHDDHPHWELMQIASIALNWLRLFSTNTVMQKLLEEQVAKGRFSPDAP